MWGNSLRSQHCHSSLTLSCPTHERPFLQSFVLRGSEDSQGSSAGTTTFNANSTVRCNCSDDGDSDGVHHGDASFGGVLLWYEYTCCGISFDLNSESGWEGRRHVLGREGGDIFSNSRKSKANFLMSQT